MEETDARALAQQYLDELSSGDPDALLVVPGESIRKRYGWVFFFNSRAFLQDGDVASQLAGNGPLVVLDKDGSVHMLGTAEPVADTLRKFERQRG